MQAFWGLLVIVGPVVTWVAVARRLRTKPRFRRHLAGFASALVALFVIGAVGTALNPPPARKAEGPTDTELPEASSLSDEAPDPLVRETATPPARSRAGTDSEHAERTPEVGAQHETASSSDDAPGPWATLFVGLPPPPERVRDWPLSKIEAVHRYLDVDRWNHGGDIGMRGGTAYSAAAKALGVHVDDLQAADQHVGYTRLKEVGERVRKAVVDTPALVPDYYHPVQATAFCGTYTLYLTFRLHGCPEQQEELRANARTLAEQLADTLPVELDGFKVTDAQYDCSKLGTHGSIGVAFLWRRGDEVQEMEPGHGTYSKMKPEDAPHWHQREWNRRQALPLPPVP